MCCFQLSGAFSGLLAAGIENMHGVGGRPGWAWIFILVRELSSSDKLFILITVHLPTQEGLFSVLVGIVGYFVTPSTPRDVKFFVTEEDKELVFPT